MVFDNPRLKIVEDKVLLPSGEIVPYIKFAEGGMGVTIICIKNNNILLQQEYSYPTDQVLYQLPGGKVEEGEKPEIAAARELKEESSLTPVDPIVLGWYYVNNRRSNAKMYVVLANKVKFAEGKAEIEESISSEWVDKSKFEDMIRKGEIVNYSVLSAWAIYKSKINN